MPTTVGPALTVIPALALLAENWLFAPLPPPAVVSPVPPAVPAVWSHALKVRPPVTVPL